MRLNFIMVGALDSILASSPLAQDWRDARADRRIERRFSCRGPVLLQIGDPPVTLRGELLDVSAHGFRLSLFQPVLAAGLELGFHHQYREGRALVAWTRPVENHFEAGCMVLRLPATSS